MILVDALRPDKLGCYGFPDETSPEIDALAARGIRFERVLAQSNWTKPSVGSFFTSRYPRTLGIYRKMDEILADRFTTLAEVLKSQGYFTIGVTANPNLNKDSNFHQGFDHYIESDVIWDWMRRESGKAKLTATTSLKSAPEVFAAALGVLDQEPRRPFFMYLHLMDVHTLVESGIRPEFQQLFQNYGREKERMYYLKVRQTSADLGQFIETFLAKPGYENTLVVILADHGEGLFDHPNVPNSDGHGMMLYESNMRVPLILCHLGGGLAPRPVEQEVRLVDLLPTLLDYVGIKVKLPGIAGKSLLPLIKGATEKIDLPEYVVAETRTQEQFKLAVYSRDWIYIENRRAYPGVNPRELQNRYGRQNGKWSDMINEKPEVVAEMAEFLKKWEKKFPQAKPTSPKEKATKETIEQLKSLGYIK